MTFNDIAVKNFKVHFRRYLSYFLCSCFAIAIFLMYAIIFFNEGLTGAESLARNVKVIIILPLIILGIFSVFFINYAHSTFITARSKEFGMFMVFGMSYKDIRKIIIIENLIIASLSIVFGFISGSIFSKIFTSIVIKILDLKNIPFKLSYESYLLTLAVFIFIFATAILYSMIKTKKMTINKLLKKDRINLEINKNKRNKFIFGIIGFIIIIASIIVFNENIKNNLQGASVFLLPIGTCFLGVYFFIANFGSVILQLSKKNETFYYKNMLELGEIEYKFSYTKKIIYISTILITITIVYLGMCYFLIFQAQTEAERVCKYDISFVQLEDINKIDKKELDQILKSE
ncbi:MAG: ABC transporter permease, partial [Clostridiales bacterium]